MELTQEQWKEFKDFKEEYLKKISLLTFQQQEANDLLEGGITSRNLTSFRNTYVINAQDSLDATYPMYVHFNIISEMIKVVSVKVDFWILNYRAYSKAGVAAGTPSGGGSTTPSGGGATSGSGGGQTSSSGGTVPVEYIVTHDGDNFIKAQAGGNGRILDANAVSHLHNHTHTVSNHQHSTPDHTHDTPAHTHPDHTHTAVYGIFEEDTSPTIKFYVSENAGVTYSDVSGPYTIDKSALDITSLITRTGSKLIKFESTLRARLSVQIEIKLDIKAR